MGKRQRFDLEDRLLDFAVLACSIARVLPQDTLGRHVASQLIRSSTSPAANYAEAVAAESRRDFIHKMKICLKELRETLVWLQLVQRTPLSKTVSAAKALDECKELVRIFAKSIQTAASR